MDKTDLKIEFMRGQGKGGQHRNKTDSCCRITHIPTGISAIHDSRSQANSKKMALKDLTKKIKAAKQQQIAKKRKANRDKKIKERNIIRTYHYPRGIVKDHRTNKTAPLKQILEKGRLDLLS